MSYNELLKEYTAQKELINSLKFELEQLKKLIFGFKQERFVSEILDNQLNLFAELNIEQPEEAEEEELTQKIEYERKVGKKKHPGRNKIPDHLPREVIIIEPEQDTTDLVKIGELITEVVDYIPASLFVRRYIRPQYAKKNGDAIFIASLPSRPLEKTIAGSGLLTFLIISKFIDHLPFYRLIQKIKREYNWKISPSTINDWFIATCTLLEPMYQLMVKILLESEYIQVDESHIKVQDGDKKGSTHRGYQWVYHDPLNKITLFHYRKGRGFEGPKKFLAGYQGWLQVDGYGVYDKFGKIPGIYLMGCHAHNRRKFYDALSHDKSRAEYVLNIYKSLYAIEDQCRGMSAEQRLAFRNKHGRPLINKLKIWLNEQSVIVMPKTPIGRAIYYALNQWHKLIGFLEDGRLEIDNNLIENKIRKLALGRKNYLFAGSHTAAQRIAMMYSFFATCKANDVNPSEWLKYVLDHIADHPINKIDELLPSNFKNLQL